MKKIKKTADTVGGRLYMAIKASGSSVQNAAELCSVTDHTMYRYIWNEISPKIDCVITICKHADVDIEWIATGEIKQGTKYASYVESKNEYVLMQKE